MKGICISFVFFEVLKISFQPIKVYNDILEEKVSRFFLLSFQISMETIFLGYVGYSLKNIPKTFYSELSPHKKYSQNYNKQEKL